MKHLILISAVILLSGCAEFLETEPQVPLTWDWQGDGRGSYQQLQTDRFQCARDSMVSTSSMSGTGGNDISSGSISSSSNTLPSCGIFVSCLASKGWIENSYGTGTRVASVISCNP